MYDVHWERHFGRERVSEKDKGVRLNSVKEQKIVKRVGRTQGNGLHRCRIRQVLLYIDIRQGMYWSNLYSYFCDVYFKDTLQYYNTTAGSIFLDMTEKENTIKTRIY